MLEDAGIEVVGEASDGIEGVALTGSLRPDVVLMDLRMPSSDGFQATAAIARDHPDVQVVVLSAYETEESAEAVLAAGAFAFLPNTAAPTVSAKPWWRHGGPVAPTDAGGASRRAHIEAEGQAIDLCQGAADAAAQVDHPVAGEAAGSPASQRCRLGTGSTIVSTSSGSSAMGGT